MNCRRENLNFSLIEYEPVAEHYWHPMTIESRAINSVTHIVIDERYNIRESDKEAMSWFAKEHPDYVQHEIEFY